MTPRLIAVLLGAFILFAAGIYILLIGIREIGPPPGANQKYEEWHRKHGGWMKIAGPLLILLAVGLAITGFSTTPR